MRAFLLVVFVSSALVRTAAQSTAFVLQAGPSLGTQRWDNTFDRQPLLRYHVALGVESINNEDQRSSLMAQVGYHLRGSAFRFQRFFFGTNNFDIVTDAFVFRNVSLMLGAKQRKAFPGRESMAVFYYGGLRGEYNLSNNLDRLVGNDPYLAIFYPQSPFVRKIVGGVSVGGGLEWAFGELVGGQLGVSIQPDVTNQYFQPPIENIIDPAGGPPITIGERSIRNLTLEVTLGLRLLRKVVYTE